MDCSPPGSSIHGIFQAKVLVGCHCLLLLDSLPITKSNLHCLFPRNLTLSPTKYWAYHPFLWPTYFLCSLSMLRELSLCYIFNNLQFSERLISVVKTRLWLMGLFFLVDFAIRFYFYFFFFWVGCMPNLNLQYINKIYMHIYKMHMVICVQYAAAKLLQSCLTLSDPRDGSPPGSPVPGILQARILEWVAISFSSAWKWKVKAKSLSHVRFLVTSWTAAYQLLCPWDSPGKSTGVGCVSTYIII